MLALMAEAGLAATVWFWLGEGGAGRFGCLETGGSGIVVGAGSAFGEERGVPRIARSMKTFTCLGVSYADTFDYGYCGISRVIPPALSPLRKP